MFAREHKFPAGPRPATQSPTRARLNVSPTRTGPAPHISTTTAPMLSASSSNNHSLFSFGRNGGGGASNEAADSSTSYDFLPSVSFDDLQSSLESASTEFKLTQFPSPTGKGSILGSQDKTADSMVDSSIAARNGTTPRAAIPPSSTRPARSGSILRRPSTSSRQPSISSSASVGTGVADAPTAPAAMRQRRQSQYPPVSNSNISKPPRKSVGPGILDSGDYGSRAPPRRRPSLASDRTASGSTRSSMDGSGRFGDATTRSLTASRAAKAKSALPYKFDSAALAADRSTIAADNSVSSIAIPRSPHVGNKGSTPSSASKRMSVMPGTHASGLGARTISPTDTRRMKRMSTMHHARDTTEAITEPMPTTSVRSVSRSPSMLPRKTSTPSSNRTTPDPNRKSYSSGLSVASGNSFNTVRTSTGSIQPRLAQSATTSRLPAPKALNLHNANSAEDEEDVPPVPAIPKVYESPKNSPAELSFLEKRKSNLGFDTSSIHSNSTGSLSSHPVLDAPVKIQRNVSKRKTSQNATLDLDKKGNVTQSRKNLQPLRLPPITLGPLSTPTATRIANLHEQNSSDRPPQSPPPRQTAKTPTTPMTASKSSFFSRHRHHDKTEPITLRSSTSIHNLRDDSPLVTGNSSSSESLVTATTKSSSHKASISPFLSSSVPKGGVEPSVMKRSKTGSDFTTAGEATLDSIKQQKPSGPRPPATKSTKRAGTNHTEKSSAPLSSPEEPPTPSSISSLRRKLSMSWKRSGSKPSLSLPPGGVPDKPADHQNARQESMPPPRIPVSSTVNSLSTKTNETTNTAKGPTNYLDSRRRKSSASSLSAIVAHDRARNDSWGTDRQHKKEASAEPSADRSVLSHNPSVMHKILKPKPSMSAFRHHDVWNSELDKDDLIAEEEMRKLAMRRKETELAARTLDALRKRASPKERVSAQDAIRIAMLNLYERGEIVDYSDIYFCGTQNAAKVVGDLKSDVPNFGYDDERGDYTIVPGDHLSYRYEIIDVLGKGSFGQVVRCIDHKTGVLVAVKIIRNKKRFHQQALVEVNILQKLREWDPKNKHSMVNFTHSFYFRGHLCISTELLDMNLYEFIKSNSFRGFSLKIIRRFTKQMLSSLNLLKQHKVIHCDLKPENILLRHPIHSEIKVIDFGSSCFENEKVYTYIQSRFYRSPEVILGMTYGMPIDMWSLGCILAELYTGVPIFPGENEQEQLACIMEVFGPPEKHLIEKSTRKKLFFDSMGKPRLTVSSKGRRRRPSSKTLQQVIKCDDDAFLDFLARCLRWDPDRRIKPEEAIRHEFITGQKTSMPVPLHHHGVRGSNRDGGGGGGGGSPIKRHNTISTPRPLPDPPGGGGGGGGGGGTANFKTVPRAAAGGAAHPSPHKVVAGLSAGGNGGPGSRRVSAATHASSSLSTLNVAKRTSTGGAAAAAAGISAGTSNLPRAANRSVSVRQDLAAAGATAAMSRRMQ